MEAVKEIIFDDSFEDDEKTTVLPQKTPLQKIMKSISEQITFVPVIFFANPEDQIEIDATPVFIPIIKEPQ